MYSCNNSSSLQSSSGGGGGGDDEFDSQAFFSTSTITAATNNSNNNIIGVRIDNNNQQNPNLSVFDSLSFLNPSSSSFSLLSSPSTSTFPNPNPNPNNRLSINPPTSKAKATPTPSPRNPKKRSRASRRAPTTVLTTDTSNFRAMVQEFTGIPAPPFSSAPLSYPRSRFDFSTHPFLLKPYPTPNASSATDSINAAAGSYSNSYQLPPSSSLNFQSLMQSQHSNNMMMAMAMATGGSDCYGAADVGLSGLIGSAWSPDTAPGDPTRYGMMSNSKEGNAEKRTRELARGEGT